MIEADIIAILTALKNKKEPISVELLMRVITPGTTSYSILDALCDYINSLQLEDSKEDASYVCGLKQKLKVLNSKLDNMNIKYNETISDYLNLKASELELKKSIMKFKNQILEKDYKIKEYECEIERFKLLS